MEQIASCGLFNQPDKTPLDSAFFAPLYDAFFHLDYLKARYFAEKQAAKK